MNRRMAEKYRFLPLRHRAVPPGLSGLFFAAFLLGQIACEQPTGQTQLAFYHWKTQLALSPQEQVYLDSLDCQVLYVKFLDIGRTSETGQIRPYSLLEVTDTTGLQ